MLTRVSYSFGLGVALAATPRLVHGQSAVSTVPALEQKAQGIDHHNRLLLVRAKVAGKTRGVVLIATTPHATAAVAGQILALGGDVLARFDDVGYLRVNVPLVAFAKVRALPDVIEARIDDGELQYSFDQGTHPADILATFKKRGFEREGTDAALPPVPAAAKVAPNPYIPMANMRAPQFTITHPTYDGRGVTIGVLEGGTLDFTHPALQVATTASGDLIPKIRGVITPSAYEPATERDTTVLRAVWADPPWSYHVPWTDRRRVRPTSPIDVSRGRFIALGKTYMAPAPGQYTFGNYVSADSLSYGTLWDSARGLVWVDTDRDDDFRDEVPLHDINQSFSTGYLHRDSTAAQPQRSISFAVAFDSARHDVYVYEGTSDHQTMVASVAAGVHLLNGAASASAPGAQLVLIDAGRSLGELIEGFIRAERDPRIDIITCSSSGGSFPESGESIVSIIVHRVLERYHKPVFVVAGTNGPFLMSIWDPGTTPGVVTVGGYERRDTYRVHFGWTMPDEEGLISYSSRGPTLDGALKPDVVAPILSIAARPCSDSSAAGDSRPTVYSLPPCYTLAGGTSSATPHAAGAAAVLISAAKQRGLPYDAARVSWALTTSARWLPRHHANEQGAGLIDVPHAWTLLQQPIDLPTIGAVAPVNTVLNRYLRRPGRGRGLFEREGWRAGQRGVRTITLTRTTGGGEGYQLRWLGNDGTFSTAADKITLPINTPVPIPIRIAVATSGMHSAELELIDLKSRLVVHRVSVAIVAAEQFTSENHYTIRHRLHLPWPYSHSLFVHVPANVGAMRVSMHILRGRVRLEPQDGENNEQLEWASFMKPYEHPRAQYAVSGEQMSWLFPAPLPSVWELLIQPFDNPAIPRFLGGDSAQYHVAADVEVTVALLGASSEPRSGIGTTAGAPTTVVFTNQLAPINQGCIATTLGMRRTISAVADSAEGPLVYDIQVDSGASSLRVHVTPTMDTTADLDLYLYDCTRGPCYLWDMNRRLAATKALSVPAPRPGTWKAVIDPAHVPTGRTPFAYTEIVTGPVYRTMVASAIRSSGGRRTWTANVRVPSEGHSAVFSNDREGVLVADLRDAGAEREEHTHPLDPLAESLGHPYRPIPIATVVMSVGKASR
jgi:subtilisin family serine protease